MNNEEEDYIRFSKSEAEKLKLEYVDHVGRKYKDAIDGIEYLIIAVDVMPANPKIRDNMWGMIIDGSTAQSVIGDIVKDVSEFTLCLFSRELSHGVPKMCLYPLRYVVDADTGGIAMGFGIPLSPY